MEQQLCGVLVYYNFASVLLQIRTNPISTILSMNNLEICFGEWPLIIPLYSPPATAQMGNEETLPDRRSSLCLTTDPSAKVWKHSESNLRMFNCTGRLSVGLTSSGSAAHPGWSQRCWPCDGWSSSCSTTRSTHTHTHTVECLLRQKRKTPHYTVLYTHK